MLQLFIGLGVSTGIRVGNALGAGNGKAAILATKVSLGLAGMCMWHLCVSHLPLVCKQYFSCGSNELSREISLNRNQLR